jgi:hypothetical protein
MSLQKHLKNQGYDLIDGPVRSHKPLQLWLKRPFDEAELYCEHLSYPFSGTEVLNEVQSEALDVNTSKKDEYSFNIGISVLEELLESLGMGDLEVSTKLKKGKKVTISYNNAITKEYPIAELEEYFSNADFNHTNRIFLRNANKNNIIILTGVMFAKNLEVIVETSFDLDAELVANFNEIAKAELRFIMESATTLKMIASTNGYFPIAIKGSRIDFDRGKFKKLKMITDNRDFF